MVYLVQEKLPLAVSENNSSFLQDLKIFVDQQNYVYSNLWFKKNLKFCRQAGYKLKTCV